MDSFSLKGKEKATADDGFFMERLEILYEQSLAELRAFAEREGRAYEEVRARADGTRPGCLRTSGCRLSGAWPNCTAGRSLMVRDQPF